MVMIDAAKMSADKGQSAEVAVAGIQADGTVMACGAYAEEIKGWGPLSYISMEGGLIAGLTPEGTLKLTGPYAEYMEAAASDLKNIAAIEVGNTGGTVLLNAMDTEGNCYQLGWDSRWGNSDPKALSPADGCLMGDET